MMKIGKIAQRIFVSISANAGIGTARKLFVDSKVPMMPVIEDGRLVGIISCNAAENADPDRRISALMSAPLFVEEDKSVDYTVRYMLKHRLARIPVVKSAIGMECIGIVASSALLDEKKKEKNGR